MTGKHKIIWFGRGFLAATAVVWVLSAGQALAQVRNNTSITSPAMPADSRQVPIIRTPQSLPADPLQQPAGGTVRRSAGGGANSDFDDPDADDADRTRSRVPQDGDLTPIVPPPVRDGIITVGEPAGLLDGEDPTREDGRAAEDIAAFASPPTGFEPGAFNIEIAPVLDRRPAQLFRFEPYQAIGIRMGSFVLFPEFETSFEATNNIFSSPQRRSDTLVDIAPRIRLVSNWRVHAVEFNASGQASFHRNFSTEDELSYTLEARGRLDITRRSNIEGLISHAVSQETRGSANSLTATGQEPTNIVTRTAALTGNHRFNRLSLQLRGSIAKIDYDATDVDISVHPAPPVFVRVDDRDYIARDVALRASWEFKPTLTGFAEVQLSDRVYSSLQGGVDRDSVGDQWRVGVSFGNTDAYLRGEISVGYGRRRPDSNVLTPIDAFLFDANLAWRASAFTSILFTANTEIGETTIGNASGGLTRTAGISVRHAFRRNLIATVGLEHSRVDYKGASVIEDTTTGSAALEYSMNRNVVLFGDYNHVYFRANQANSAYHTDQVRVGVRVRR